MYTIGQLAHILGINRDKLRYYEEKGILAPAQDGGNHYRQYSVNDFNTVLLIEFYRSLDPDSRRWRSCGFSPRWVYLSSGFKSI